MLDLLIRGGTVVDGTGTPGRVADVGVRDGKVVAIGEGAAAEGARREVDASGLVVAPGIIDLHTHYDAQVLWDPTVSPSPLHGVTTILGGNCGFSVAPLAPGDAGYVMRLMGAVEGIPMEALEQGATWDWGSFGDWLGRLDGAVAVNAGFHVGHSTLRRAAMGDAAFTGAAATPEQLARMVALLHEALAAGALGLSSAWDNVHMDGDGHPVPSRFATHEELLALSVAVGEHEGTTLEFIPWVGEIPPERMTIMAEMSLAANRPLNWNLLGSMSPTEIYRQQLEACDIALERGALVYALTLPDFLKMRAAWLLGTLPPFDEVLAMDDGARRAAVADPAMRSRLLGALAAAAAGDMAALSRPDLLEIAEARSAGTERYVGRTVAEVAAELGRTPEDVLLDVVVAEGLPLTVMLPSLVPSLGASDAGWRARAEVWRDPRVVLGGSDAGAHLNLLCHANYPTVVLGEAVRKRGLLPLEEAVRLMTDVPARLYGLRGRGRVAEGWCADLVLFDPDTVASGPSVARWDLPGGGERLYAEAEGIERVLVGGREVVVHGQFTDARPGTVLRSGVDTDTTTVPGRS